MSVSSLKHWLAAKYMRFHRVLVNSWGAILWLVTGKLIYEINAEIILSEACARDKEYQQLSTNREMADPDWLTPYKIVAEEIASDRTLTAIGRFIMLRFIKDSLNQRLDIALILKNKPDILQVPVKRPVFIVGPMRTGSTLLHNLLAQDPSNKAPLFYEIAETNQLLKRNRKNLKFHTTLHDLTMKSMYPNLDDIHDTNYLLPHECFPLFERSFVSKLYPLYMRSGLPGYTTWLDGQQERMLGVYTFYKQQLQLILMADTTSQSESPRRLVLKDSIHVSYLDILLQVFPDACIINLHRDPAKVVPSTCSLFDYITTPFYRDSNHTSDRKSIATRVMTQMDTSVSKLMEFHKTNKMPEKQFINIGYPELVANPIEVVKTIYNHFDLEFNPQVQGHMESYLNSQQQKKRKKHHYDIGRYGITEESVRQRYKNYINYFDINCK